MNTTVITRTRKEVYQLWLDALRSGKYRQGQGQLRQTDGNGHNRFCCLGVLCDLAVKDGGPKWNSERGPENHAAEPSAKILKFMGLTDNEVNDLIGLNDDELRNFKEIADYIEHVIMPEKVKV